MDIVRGLGSLPLQAGPSVSTVGFFDGVHLGHQAVFATTVERASERNARSVAVTFDRHPREVLAPGSEPRLLTTVERKASLIEATGIDTLVVLPFTAEFSRVTAEEFVRDVIVGGLRSRARGHGRELHVRLQGGGHGGDAARRWERRSA